MGQPVRYTEPTNVPRFSVGEKLPIKGVWFEISEIAPTGLTLRAIGETNAAKKKTRLRA